MMSDMKEITYVTLNQSIALIAVKVNNKPEVDGMCDSDITSMMELTLSLYRKGSNQPDEPKPKRKPRKTTAKKKVVKDGNTK